MTITTILKAAQASDFLAAVPALLGFQPSESVVLVPFRGNATAGAMRIDLPAAENAADMASAAAGLLCKITGVTGVAIVVYGTADQAESVSAPIVAQAEMCGLDVVDALYVTGTEWAHVGERTMTPLGAVPAHIAALAAEADAQAGAVLPEVPEAFAAEVADALPVASATTATDAVVAAFERALTLDVADATPMDAATLLVLLHRPLTRDVALVQWARDLATGAETLDAQMASTGTRQMPTHLAEVIVGEGARPDADRLRDALRVCRYLAAVAPEAAKVGALVAAGWLSWALGRSSHADAYVRQALTIDPDHTMAGLISQMVNAGHLPEWAFIR
ncbi:hypothetical protein DC31_06485 [Microbacterium sp. CH12i]|uniref:DUF4192 family protein n=1 Tax=Microbacterium sp. CH12i TaxID=1479651 RepID=UPI0004612EA7|nr:DUF4192 family protein [Microbacterium sp. CH12i]KDA04524.1 hypothetical protein DC31_06485 [Microbacterium sp. CH12i]